MKVKVFKKHLLWQVQKIYLVTKENISCCQVRGGDLLKDKVYTWCLLIKGVEVLAFEQKDCIGIEKNLTPIVYV